MLRALFVTLLLGSSIACAQTHTTKLALILPFENRSKAPGLEWVSDSFPEVLGQSLGKGRLFVISRNDRQYAFDRLGIPTGVQLSLATLLRVAQEMDADYIVRGSYDYDGRAFAARAQVMDVARLKLSRDIAETGGMAQTIDVQSQLASDISREIERLGGPPAVHAVTPALRLDALENYIKGINANGLADRLKYLKEAVRLAPSNHRAVLALGKAYLDSKEYEQALAWLGKVPESDAVASEAKFFLGLAAFGKGDLALAESAFRFTAQRVPLVEVFNNLGVIAARRRQPEAIPFFERAVAADARDADYRFNLAIATLRSGDRDRGVRELKAAAALDPQDAEVRQLLRAGAIDLHNLPAERLKRNYDESSYRQLALEIQNINEARYAALTPQQHAAAHVAHGNELLLQGTLDQAETEFREAIILDPTNALAHAGLAEALEARGDLGGARTEANAANTLGSSAQAWVVLARIELRQDNRAAAAQNVERALQIDPTNVRALELQKQLSARP